MIIFCMFFCGSNLTLGESKLKFNNTDHKEDLITKDYSEEEILYLKNTMESKSVAYTTFQKMFDVECLRKTYQGYYAVLFLNNGKESFVFIDSQLKLRSMMIVKSFPLKNDFERNIKKFSTKSQVLEYDLYSIVLPISSLDMTAHIVKEGVYLIKYMRISNDVLLEDPMISSISFIANNELSKVQDQLIRFSVPYILEIDKAN